MFGKKLDTKMKTFYRWHTFQGHYFSTYCLHDLHTDCRLTCKICAKPCRCRCHRDSDGAVTEGK